ncbi:NAD(P)H-binding protein [Glycomyces tenuis]|uniref:NAD(P)H-binding protein n=1 Tax=Glycomyces tenuis TaxID=58116 RepID=UPI0004080F68|nr:NAD(P)H-binding protein [Glycomyces tenuis]
MILVSGASGTTGSEVAELLVQGGERVRVMSRRAVEIPGAEAVRADFTDPASLAAALEGVSAVYLVTAPPKPVIDHDVALVEAAKAAGVRRIVKLGAISGADPGTWHARAERPTRDSGLEWTILRPCTFASNMLAYAPMVKAAVPLPNPTGDGAVGVIDPRDIAAVAVEALTDDRHVGREYTLTGPELLTFPRQAEILQDVLGTGIATEAASAEQMRAVMVRSGMDPDGIAESLAGMARLAEGRYAVVTGTVARILGRAPIGFADWAEAHRHVFR